VANKDILELVFKHSGGVELRAVDGRADDGSLDTVVWASDSDQDFTDQFPSEIFEPNESEPIIDYLIEADILDEEEADNLRIFSESLDGRDIEDVGDPDDDEGDEDEEFDELDREVRPRARP
jgi:hypothetical protein